MAIVSTGEIQECYDFAVTAWNNRSQSQRQFGTQETRSRNSFIADQISGKLAEYVFKHTMENAFDNVSVRLNFIHYWDPLHTDEGDVEIYRDKTPLPLRIDIKGSSHFAQWLLVEQHKYRDLQSGAPLSDMFVMVKFAYNVPDNRSLRHNPEQILEFKEIHGEVVGWANHSDFISEMDHEEWFTYHRGDRPWRRDVLPASAENINDIQHLHNYINWKKRNKNISDNDASLNISLDAEINVGLPIHWLQPNLEGILEQIK
jgi:hypothetical protein